MMAPYKSPPKLGVAITIDPFTTVIYIGFLVPHDAGFVANEGLIGLGFARKCIPVILLTGILGGGVDPRNRY